MSRPALLYVVSAPSGTGKTTVLTRVLCRTARVRFSVSHTTRPPRAGEQEGREYHFVDRQRFERLVEEGRFLEWAQVHGELYGTSREELERAAREGVDLLLDIDVQGAAQVRARMPEAVTVFMLPPSPAALEGRLRGRGGDSPEAVRRRLAGARSEVGRWAEYDYVLVNDDAEECAAALEGIIRATRSRSALMAEVAGAIVRDFESRAEESE